MKRSVREPLRGVRLLLLEQDDDLRAGLADLLARKGCFVREARDADEARAALGEGAVDVLLADFDRAALPASSMLEHAPSGLRVLALMGPEVPPPGGGARVLRTPVDVEQLLEAIAASVAREIPAAAPARASRPLRLALYLDSRAASGARARRRFYETLSRFGADGVEVIEVDVRAGSPPEGVPPPTFLPSVCRLEPVPHVWLLGDLADLEPLEALLETDGAARPAPPLEG